MVSLIILFLYSVLLSLSSTIQFMEKQPENIFSTRYFAIDRISFGVSTFSESLLLWLLHILFFAIHLQKKYGFVWPSGGYFVILLQAVSGECQFSEQINTRIIDFVIWDNLYSWILWIFSKLTAWLDVVDEVIRSSTGNLPTVIRQLNWRETPSDFFLVGIHSMQGWTATTRHGVTS